MDTVENPRAVIGANNPPDADPFIVRANEAVDFANRWLTERRDLDKWDAEMADKAQDTIDKIALAFKDLDSQRLEENRAHDTKQKEKYGAPGDPDKGKAGSGVLGLLKSAAHQLGLLKRQYLQREERKLETARQAAEAEAKRLREEAEAAAARAIREAAMKGGDPLRAQSAAEEALYQAQEAERVAAAAPVKAQIKGNLTTTARSLRDKWSAEITDLSAAAKYYNGAKNPFKPRLAAAIKACIQDIADDEAKIRKVEGEGVVPGIRFVKERV